jgi:glycerophosphoryl diester phosphodiesterase
MILYGHRGARGEAPENTLPGFHHARQVGVTHLEFDVRMSRDGHLVVIHDDTVDRTTGARGKVSGFTARELSALDARDGFPDWPGTCGIPTLDAVLDACRDMAGFQIEIKKPEDPSSLPAVCEGLASRIREHGVGDRTVVSSFDPAALERMKAAAPGIPTAFIGGFRDVADVEAAIRLRCAAVCPHLPTTSAEILRAARGRGLQVCGWMGNTPEEVTTLLEWGVDAITTDFPSRILPLLGTSRPG